MGISDKSEKKNKSITFVSNTEYEENQCHLDTDEGMTNSIVLLGRQFNKVLKRIDKKSRPNVKNIPFGIMNNNDFQKRTRIEERSNKGKGIQCHGCEGFGHIRVEYPTYLKKQKKGLSVSWSDDDDSESEPEDEASKYVTALTRRYEFDEDSCDEELSYEELAASYRELCIRSEEVKKCVSWEKNRRKIYLNCRLKKKDFNPPSLIFKRR